MHKKISSSNLNIQVLSNYDTGDYVPGTAFWKNALWYFVGSRILKSYWIPSSSFKIWLLRKFGSQIGHGVYIKPGIRVKFPWRLKIGNNCWIGEDVWIDNLAYVTLEDNVCISQGVYLCTGNHDWTDPRFRLNIKEIYLANECWIAAKSVVGPGVCVEEGAVLTLGSVAIKSLKSMTIYTGNPAMPVKIRQLKNTHH
jgi:putative colanic acid biosynthesis acetyltransferase WcaF